ncbi:MAG TPA: hypothetical protein VK171_00945 [Fimbriimonas sp.]|nr:hypothetical protein [Fimbriimonas sp.]
MPIDYLRNEVRLIPFRIRMAWWVLKGGRQRLDGQISQTLAAGYPFTADMIPPEQIENHENGFVALQHEFVDTDTGFLDKLRDQKEAAWNLEQASLPPNTKLFIEKARVVGSKTKLDAKRDLDQSFTGPSREYSQLRAVMNSLAFESIHQAKFGDGSGALQSLMLAQNVVRQLSSERSILGVIVYVSLHAWYYRAIANVAFELRSDPLMQPKLLELVDAELPEPDLDLMMKGEFYGCLAWLRNTNGYPRLKSQKPVDLEAWFEPFEPSTLVRTGVPTSTQGQFLLSELLRILKEFELGPHPTGNWEKGLTQWNHFIERPTPCYPNLSKPQFFGVRLQAFAAIKKRYVWRELARFAVQTCFAHSDTLPGAVDSRPDIILGGTLRYKRIGRQMCFYSTGENREDEGSPWLENGNPNPSRIDDMGMLLPNSDSFIPNIDAFFDAKDC